MPQGCSRPLRPAISAAHYPSAGLAIDSNCPLSILSMEAITVILGVHKQQIPSFSQGAQGSGARFQWPRKFRFLDVGWGCFPP